jgi:hypothetical protein
MGMVRIREVYTGSGFFSHPGSWIPDPTIKEQGRNKVAVLPFLVENYLSF